MSKQSRSVAVIDTNVFMGAGTAPFTELKDTDIVIPMLVIMELEKHRGDDGGAGWAARVVLHYIEDLRTRYGGASLVKGAKSYNGNTVTIDPDHKDVDEVRAALSSEPDADMYILSVAYNIAKGEKAKKDGGRKVRLYTNDLPMRIKADTFLELDVSPWGSGVTRPFTGIADADISGKVDDENDVTADLLRSALDETDSKAGHILVRARLDPAVEPMPFLLGEDAECLCNAPSARIGAVTAQNAEQSAAIRYLKDDSITVVSLGGVAGAGKTLLALAAGMDSMRTRRSKDAGGKSYGKILVFRSMYEVGQQKVGFLPGDLDEKMRPWAQAVWDDVDKIDRLSQCGPNSRKRRHPEGGDGVKRGVEERHPEIEVSPISWIRGRTIEDAFIIVDDAQSLERPLLLDILTRLGESSRIVFTFDMDQQDNPNPHMSQGTSITSVIDDFMDDPMFAHIDFTESRRSRIAQKAAGLLRRR